MYYLMKHIDAANFNGENLHHQTDMVWQYENKFDAIDAADRYNENLQMMGIPSSVCFYYVVN